MSDVVFGVFTGHYSDWECKGFFEDANSAYMYCDMRNLTAKWESDDGYYVIPLRKIRCEFAKKPEAVRFRYMMYFDMDRNGELHVLKKDADGFIVCTGAEEYDNETTVPDIEFERAEQDEQSYITVTRFGRVIAKVVMQVYDTERALEIAEEQVEKWKLDIVEFIMDKKEEMQNSTDKDERRRWANATWVRGFDAE